MFDTSAVSCADRIPDKSIVAACETVPQNIATAENMSDVDFIFVLQILSFQALRWEF
jgi:hypothetical protein